MPYQTEPTLEHYASLNVLVVDDDLFINQLVQLRLRKRGYQVSSAHNGKEALAHIAQTPPDLIFLDVTMPEVDGLTVLQNIRRERFDIAVIMMTAYGSERVAVESLRQGADDYLSKPFEAVDFDGVLERTVRRLLLTRQNALLRRRLEQEMAAAAQVQADLLPSGLPSLPNFEMAAHFQPARAVSGDFYDWSLNEDGTLNFTLADVMGKGMPAALLMAMARPVMRVAGQLQTPAQALNTAHNVMGADLERSGRFITLFHARLKPATREVTYTDAGHGLGFVHRHNHCIEPLQSFGLPLGIFADAIYSERTLTLTPGDHLVVYSDGLLEATGAASAGEDALAAVLTPDMSAQQAITALLAQVVPTSELPDDLTVLALRCVA